MSGYTRPWEPFNMLLGSRDADEIDDAVRDFANDLDERFKDIVVDPAADPWVPQAKNVTWRTHWSGGNITLSDLLVSNPAYMAPGGGTTACSASIKIPLTLPVGSIIRNIKAKILRVDSSSVVQIVFTKVDDTGTASSIAAASPPTDPGTQEVDLGVLAETITSGYTYFVSIDLVSNATPFDNQRFYSVQVTADLVWGS